jgi:hypothetical protein
MTRASAVGVLAKAVVQPITMIGSNSEAQEVGFETTSEYRLRLIGYSEVLGAQSQVEWNGQRHAIDGDPQVYNGSRRTAHIDYVMSRS